ncbi:MAG TPA: TetR family transcriptional regulator [Candidatus Xenobia bacterium]|nr:TetR family transcriptional regulator [Candidatus Xenobia bacterium]
MPTATLDTAARNRGRRARRKAELRQRILHAAFELFARQGFFLTTVEQITEAADVAKGTFFNYFPTKEHVLGGFGDMQLARIEAAVTEARLGRRPAKEILHRLIHALAEAPGRSQSLVRSMMVANLSSEAVRAVLRRKLMRGRRLLAEIIAYGQRRGEITRRRKPIELARLFQQVTLGTFLIWAAFPQSKLDGWIEPTFELYWSGVTADHRG